MNYSLKKDRLVEVADLTRIRVHIDQSIISFLIF